MNDTDIWNPEAPEAPEDQDGYDEPAQPADGSGTATPSGPLSVRDEWRLLDPEIREEAVTQDRRRQGKQWADRLEDARTPTEPLPWIMLADVEDAKVNYRFADLLPEAGRMLLVAKRKTGKTTATANLARSYLDGTRALGAFTTAPTGRRVAILNYEVSAAQIAAWLNDVGLPKDRVVLVNLRGKPNPLRTEKGRDQLVAVFTTMDVGMVIIDPFAVAFTGTSQNDAAEVASFLATLDQTVNRGGADELILCVHAGWEAERTRGSSALEDWPDVVVTIVKDDKTGERYLSAFGRDVEIDEDQLLFDPATRRLTMAKAGSRQQVRDDARSNELVTLIVQLVTKTPGLNVAGLTKAATESGAHFQRGDIGKAAIVAGDRGLIDRVNGAQNSVNHYPKASSPEPSRKPTRDGSKSGPDPSYRGGTTEGLVGAVEPTSSPGGVGHNGNGQKPAPCTNCGDPLAWADIEINSPTHDGCEPTHPQPDRTTP